MQTFNSFTYPRDIEKRLLELKSKPAEYWLALGKKRIDSLIKFVLGTTPAYRRFLKDSGINPQQIRGYKDLQKLPQIDKNSYLRKQSYLDLFPNKNISSKVISATSGSTGELFYFPRGENLDEQHKYIAEIFLKNQWEIDKLNTLFIIVFGLGIWIGGIYNYKGLDRLKGKYKISIAPVGTNKELAIKTILTLGNFYDQVVLMGYPPFIKDLIDEGGDYYKINWKKYRLRILNAAEAFPETFRKYVAKKAGLKDMLNDNINIYGSVELGTMAHETCLSNLIRYLAVENSKIWEAIFPAAKNTPTLAQYHPYIVWFEEKDGLILASGYGESIPLLRYSFPDRGGVIYFDDMITRLKRAGVDIFKEAEKRNYHNKILKLPFVYVYERADSAVSLVGIQIFPEYIRQILLEPAFQKYFTGKFSMQTIYDKNYNQKLQVNIELKKNIKAPKNLVKLVSKEIFKSLDKNSSEFHHLLSTSSEKHRRALQPNVLLYPYEDSKYFRAGIKQKWAIK